MVRAVRSTKRLIHVISCHPHGNSAGGRDRKTQVLELSLKLEKINPLAQAYTVCSRARIIPYLPAHSPPLPHLPFALDH